MAELESRLAELGEQLELPATPPLAARVGAELRAAERPARPRHAPPRLRLALLSVLAALLLAAAAAAAVPATRHAVLELLGLRGETIERVPRLPENARAKPSRRWTNHVPPESGTRPIPTNPGTNVAASDATRRSHAQANERPAPAAGPLTAAITGFSSVRTRRMFGW